MWHDMTWIWCAIIYHLYHTTSLSYNIRLISHHTKFKQRTSHRIIPMWQPHHKISYYTTFISYHMHITLYHIYITHITLIPRHIAPTYCHIAFTSHYITLIPYRVHIVHIIPILQHITPISRNIPFIGLHIHITQYHGYHNYIQHSYHVTSLWHYVTLFGNCTFYISHTVSPPYHAHHTPTTYHTHITLYHFHFTSD